jgi:hypothetical protein
MKKLLQTLIMVILVGLSYNASACIFIPTIYASGPLTFCQGGSVTLLTNGGYVSYLWSNGSTNSAITVTTSGSYTVYTTDTSGCTGTSSITVITVNSDPTPTITAGGPTTFCQGGSVTLTCNPVGASYLWSNGATTQSITVSTSGTYTVTMTNGNGCSGTSASITCTVNPLPTPMVSSSGPTTFCSSQNDTLTCNPGFGSYLWSTGATTQKIIVNTSGSYSVTLTDINGCTGASFPIDITVSTSVPPSPCPMTGNTNVVQGFAYTYSVAPVIGATDYFWTLPGGWSGSSTTNSLTVVAGGAGGNICVTAHNSCGFSVPCCIPVNIVNCTTSFILFPDTTQLHHYFVTDTIYGQQPYHYDWSWGDLSPNDTIAYPNHTYADSGIYTICLHITDNAGCQSSFCDSNYHIMRTTNYMVYVNVIPHTTVGINQPELNNSISLYPNPTTGNITLSYSQNASNYSQFIITDITGREVYSQQFNHSAQSNINLTELNNGIYFWKLISGNNISDKGKIAVMK